MYLLRAPRERCPYKNDYQTAYEKERNLDWLHRIGCGGGEAYDRRRLADAQRTAVLPAAANRQLSQTTDPGGGDPLSQVVVSGGY